MSYMKYSVILEDKVVDMKMVIRLEDLAVIPFDDGNLDYIEYKEWLKMGNNPIDFVQGVFENGS